MIREVPKAGGGSAPASLAVWISAGIAMYVLLGTFVLLMVFENHLVSTEKSSFESLARANVDFLEQTKLPQTEKMAAQLGVVIGAKVFFIRGGNQQVVAPPGFEPAPPWLGLPCDGKVQVAGDGHWLVGLACGTADRVVFVRRAPSGILAVDRRDTWLAMIAFWGLSLGLAWVLARRVSRPLRVLSDSLPLVGTNQTLPRLPVHRRDEIGGLARVLTSTHDSLREERERRQAAERLAMLGRMTASLAHEVRNPLAAIQLHAQLMQGAGPDDAEMSRGMILGEAERIESLVSQWLGFARPGSPEMSRVDLVECVGESLRSIAHRASHAKVVVDSSGLEGVGAVVIPADRFRLGQVLGNLFLNAIQSMPRGGVMAVGIVDSGMEVGVVVADDGIGFSEEAMSRLGEPFYTEKEGGMGLGLAVAVEICKAHGGRITVENRPEGGSRVTAWLSKQPELRTQTQDIS